MFFYKTIKLEFDLYNLHKLYSTIIERLFIAPCIKPWAAINILEISVSNIDGNWRMQDILYRLMHCILPFYYFNECRQYSYNGNNIKLLTSWTKSFNEVYVNKSSRNTYVKSPITCKAISYVGVSMSRLGKLTSLCAIKEKY